VEVLKKELFWIEWSNVTVVVFLWNFFVCQMNNWVLLFVLIDWKYFWRMIHIYGKRYS
jgi:hypothetical protein